MTRSTLPALTQEIACSLERPPNTTATLGLRAGIGAGWSTVRTLPGEILADVPTTPTGPDRSWTLSTRAVTAGRPARDPDAPFSVPVTFASTYVAGGDVEYGRYGNPTWTALETAVGDLEGGWALAFASGLAAASAVLSLLPEGGTALAPDNAYSGTLSLLRERTDAGRAKLRVVEVSDTDAVRGLCAGTDLVWVESPTNPRLDVADLPALAQAAHQAGALFVVDNTFATPVLQRPLESGADLVVHSATKLIAGHSDVLMGLVCGRDEQLARRLDDHRRLHGAVPGPMEAWLALRGLRTLAVRMERAQASAATLAGRLAEHPAVQRVRYPGSGSMLAIEVRGGAAAADQLGSQVRLWINATSLGGVESSLERRRRWESESHAVSQSLLRLSVGIEDVEDLWTDLRQALDALGGGAAG
jgi:cystathionine gamma-synthase